MSKRKQYVVHLACVDKAKVEVPFDTVEGADKFAAWVGPFFGGHYRVTGRSERDAVAVPDPAAGQAAPVPSNGGD